MLICTVCGKECSERDLPWRCSCGGPLSPVFEGAEPMNRHRVNPSEPGMWRYASSLPPGPGFERITMGEGWTPLVRQNWGGTEVYLKLDYTCPTGSYKDRGMAYLVSIIHSLGVREVIEDSSGNAGASMAAYSARAGIKCRVFVPEYTSAGKCVQITSSGAELVRIPGTREDTTRAAEKAAESTYYASHNWSPWFAHGVKTFAFEIWEQLGFEAPDALLLPAGQGSLVIGCYLAFSELLESGEIQQLPKLYALQPENCAPLVKAFEKDSPCPEKILKKETIAEGISSAEPVRGREVLKAVRESGGAVLSFSEQEIWDGFLKLCRLGYYVEPTSAIAAAAADRLFRTGTLRSGTKTAAILTGSGLKAGDKILSLLSDPPRGK